MNERELKKLVKEFVARKTRSQGSHLTQMPSSKDIQRPSLGRDCLPPCIFYVVCSALAGAMKKNGNPFRCPLDFGENQ